MSVSPCYGCDKRAEGCHAACAAYGQWRAQREAASAVRLDASRQRDEYMQMQVKRKMRNDRRRRTR